MTCFRKAFAICVVSGALVTPLNPYLSLASAQSQLPAWLADTEFSYQADFDTLFALGADHALRDDLYADLSVAMATESFVENGWRLGVDTRFRLTTGDGRRGFSAPALSGPVENGQVIAGSLTGLSGPNGLDRAEGGLHVEQADAYLQTAYWRLRAGWGRTATQLERPAALHALRLSRADGAVFDATGLNLSHTGLTLAEAAPTVSIQSRRLVGFQLSASYSPGVDPCGQACQPSAPDVLRPDLDHLWSLATSFSRRSPQSGVRWDVYAGVERAQSAGVLSDLFEDPWLVNARVMREAGDLTLAVSALTGEDGYRDNAYRSVSASLAWEQGDWVVSAETGFGDADLVAAQSWSWQLGASRLVGEAGVLGVSLLHVQQDQRLEDRSATQLLVEAGLRF